MRATNKKSHARIPYNPLQDPNPTPSPSVNRDKWLKETVANFVSPSKRNREYYEVILKTLWPEGHGIPGPHVTESKIREAINAYRGAEYVDTFRRMRELQGEEGLLGIIKGGSKYQLVDLTVSSKRIPRTHLSDAAWKDVLERYNGVCAACGRSVGEKGFQQDHKVPRLRGGSDDLSNWQPLCDECNNFKSTACRDCHLDCKKCCWAFPEKFKPLNIPGDLIARLRKFASERHSNADSIVIELIESVLKGRKSAK